MGGVVVRVGGQHEHRRRIPLTSQPLEDVTAGQLRQSAIKHDHVVRMAQRSGQSRLAIERAIHLKTLRFKESSGRFRNSLVVFDEQDVYSAGFSRV